MSNPLLQADTASTQSLPPPGLVEKVSLERYVPPRKPSLVGLSRAELADAFAAIGVPAAQRKMRVQQLWQWLYVRGARHFDEMTSVSKELRAQLDARYTLARPEDSRRQAWPFAPDGAGFPRYVPARLRAIL